jgi:hypothetical protein
MDAVGVGQCVKTASGPSKVTFASMSFGRGVHTLVTADTNGMMVVDGVEASSFGVNHAIANNYYNIHRY